MNGYILITHAMSRERWGGGGATIYSPYE